MGKETAMSKYLVKLTPLGKFFFGGDMSFKSGREKEDENYVSYIIHSSTMPQQTSLLGMLRFLLLSSNEELFDKAGQHILIEDKDRQDIIKNEVKKLIGERSFSVDSNVHASKDFGCIKSLGPCFLYNKDEKKAYYPSAKDLGLEVSFAEVIQAHINGVVMDIPEIKVKDNQAYYSGKDYLENYYITADGSTMIRESELFTRDSRIGIDKDYEGKVKNAAFYKQISYRLDEKYCFAFEVEVDDRIDLAKAPYQHALVKVGADASYFLFEAEKLEGGWTYPTGKDNEHRVVLLSDTCLPNKPLAVRYAITRIRPFRCLTTVNSIDPKEYNVRYQSFRSGRLDLFQAGSVFFFRDKAERDKFCKSIDEMQGFKQIGYNRYC